MMYLILTLFVGLCALAWYQKLKKLEDTKKKSFLWKTGFTLILLSVIFLTVTGRLHWIGAAITAVIPILAFLFRWSRRIFPLLKIFGGIKQKPSQFKTKTLQISLNFSTMSMSGKVLKGKFAGKNLQDLNPSEFEELTRDCKLNDKESYALLYAFSAIKGRNDNFQDQNYTKDKITDMSEEEAYEILGLENPSSKSEISKAHKRLIQKLHPDRGGSDYLAAKINAAKDKIS